MWLVQNTFNSIKDYRKTINVDIIPGSLTFQFHQGLYRQRLSTLYRGFLFSFNSIKDYMNITQTMSFTFMFLSIPSRIIILCNRG